MDLREVKGLVVRRCPPRLVPKASNVPAAKGLAYERKVARELTQVANILGGNCEHNPWFEYRSNKSDKWACVVPDCIVSLGSIVYVIEVKLTYVPEAKEKLDKVYIPIVRAGLCAMPYVKVFAVVIVRNLSPDARPRISRLADANGANSIPVLQWLGHGSIYV